MASTGILSEADDYMETVDGVQISIRRTIVEKESDLRKDAAIDTVSHLSSAPLLSTQVDKYMPHQLANAIFCGHLVTDMDSIAGAIGAAELYGGTPARASEINSETKFCLEHWGVTQPEPIEELLQSNPDAAVCLVDHQQTSQLNPAIDVNRIVGVIDHHALQNATIVTDMPIYIDIRPWGSMSTIIAHTFITMNRRPTKSTAGMLLCAILSDTLNLQGPTTTDWDRMMVAVLVELTGVEDVQFLASQQFKAKSSELAGLTAEQLVNGDQKVFTFKTDKFEGSVGFAVVETTDDEVIMSRSAELLMALSEDKEAKGLSVLFLAVVNIVSLKSNLLLCGPVERSLAVAAFKNGKLIPDLSAGMPPSNATSASTSTSTSTSSNNVTVMDLGGLVSRKKDFIPAVTGAVKAGW
eukprot:CAMPEP_0174963242 /NCGR_PEP_ID=MMETSP0004_2-20121128/5221_1 /TAXON_ID=420556 /ORGANISM="Ochromonas sp., Strain CCMP1393" /LENGTH=409 /DNA_ID=CAMNT_0016211845 /DNA_START=165 /DNA_END=1391 /DNA_ORIENTATION=-